MQLNSKEGLLHRQQMQPRLGKKRRKSGVYLTSMSILSLPLSRFNTVLPSAASCQGPTVIAIRLLVVLLVVDILIDPALADALD